MKRPAILAAIMLCLPGAMCSTTGGTYPARADVEALVVPRPRIPLEALDDPGADARYRSDVRAWEDDFVKAGGRVCRFLQRSGMAVTCPAAEQQELSQ